MPSILEPRIYHQSEAEVAESLQRDGLFVTVDCSLKAWDEVTQSWIDAEHLVKHKLIISYGGQAKLRRID